MIQIVLIQGANMNRLGLRQPEIYGTTTAAQLDERVRRYAEEKGFAVEIFYSNGEGETIDRLYRAQQEGADAIVINPGGFTYAGYALRDAMLGITVPCVEVHLSNHYVRDIHSVTGAASQGVIMGFGIEGYFLGLDAALFLASQARAAP